jgi:hypothetical protein
LIACVIPKVIYNIFIAFEKNLVPQDLTIVFPELALDKPEPIRYGKNESFSSLSEALKEDINSDDFFPFLIALGNYSIGGDPNFTIGVGVALTSDFRYNALIPIAALRYESEKTKLEIVYPNLNLLYKKSSNLEFGLFGNVDGAISNVQGNSFDNITIQYQRNLQVLIAPTVSFRIFKQIFGHLKAGVVPISNIQALDGSFQKIDVLTRELDPHFFVRSGISLRLNN